MSCIPVLFRRLWPSFMCHRMAIIISVAYQTIACRIRLIFSSRFRKHIPFPIVYFILFYHVSLTLCSYATMEHTRIQALHLPTTGVSFSLSCRSRCHTRNHNFSIFVQSVRSVKMRSHSNIFPQPPVYISRSVCPLSLYFLAITLDFFHSLLKVCLLPDLYSP